MLLTVEEEGSIYAAHTTHTAPTTSRTLHMHYTCTLHTHMHMHTHMQVAFKEEKQTKPGAPPPPTSAEAIDSEEEEASPLSRRNSKEKPPQQPRGPSVARPKPRLHRPSSLIRQMPAPDETERPAWSAPPSGRCGRHAHAMAARSDSLDLGEQDDAELQAAVERARWSAGARGPPPPGSESHLLAGSRASSI